MVTSMYPGYTSPALYSPTSQSIWPPSRLYQAICVSYSSLPPQSTLISFLIATFFQAILWSFLCLRQNSSPPQGTPILVLKWPTEADRWPAPSLDRCPELAVKHRALIQTPRATHRSRHQSPSREHHSMYYHRTQQALIHVHARAHANVNIIKYTYHQVHIPTSHIRTQKANTWCLPASGLTGKSTW